MALAILYDATAPRLTCKFILPGQLDSLLAIVIHIRKAEHMSRQLSRRIVSPVLPFKKNARNIEFHHLGRHLWRQMPLQVNKIAPRSTLRSIDTLANFLDIEPDQVG